MQEALLPAHLFYSGGSNQREIIEKLLPAPSIEHVRLHGLADRCNGCVFPEEVRVADGAHEEQHVASVDVLIHGNQVPVEDCMVWSGEKVIRA